MRNVVALVALFVAVKRTCTVWPKSEFGSAYAQRTYEVDAFRFDSVATFVSTLVPVLLNTCTLSVSFVPLVSDVVIFVQKLSDSAVELAGIVTVCDIVPAMELAALPFASARYA